jgi:hypothetical protein
MFMVIVKLLLTPSSKEENTVVLLRDSKDGMLFIVAK